jgi:hypothetical protein
MLFIIEDVLSATFPAIGMYEKKFAKLRNLRNSIISQF